MGAQHPWAVSHEGPGGPWSSAEVKQVVVVARGRAPRMEGGRRWLWLVGSLVVLVGVHAGAPAPDSRHSQSRRLRGGLLREGPGVTSQRRAAASSSPLRAVGAGESKRSRGARLSLVDGADVAGVAALAEDEPPPVGKEKRLRALALELQRLPKNANASAVGALLAGQSLVQHNMTSLLLVLKRRHKWRTAWLVAAWAEQPGCPMQLSTMHYNLLLSACARAQPPRAFEIFDRMRAPRDVVTYNTAMAAALNHGEPGKALAYFEQMGAEEVEPSTISFNTAIAACTKLADWELALELFRRMEAGGIERSTVTYTGLIDACAEGMQLDKAMALFTYMEVAGVPRNPITYAVAINACSRNGQWELGLQLLQEMGRKGVQPDTVVFNAAISACEKGRAWETALQLMGQMRRLGMRMTAVTYGAGISACQKGQQWREALALLREMGEARVRPNTIVYSAAISACGSSGEWRTALELMDEMRAASIEANTITYNAAIQACERGGAWEEAVRVHERMKEAGVQQDTITHNALVRACERAGQWQLAYDFMRQMQLADTA